MMSPPNRVRPVRPMGLYIFRFVMAGLISSMIFIWYAFFPAGLFLPMGEGFEGDPGGGILPIHYLPFLWRGSFFGCVLPVDMQRVMRMFSGEVYNVCCIFWVCFDDMS